MPEPSAGPYSVVLFDEIEKAHPEIFNALLQVLDDGRMTDGQGRVVDFKNTIIIMTSNLGSQLWALDTATGRPRDVTREQVTDVLRSFFRPEFLNRVDEIVVFKPLTREDLSEIVGIQLKHVARLLADRGFKLEISQAARDYLSEVGFDPQWGARPLKRAIQREIQDPLAMQILAGAFPEAVPSTWTAARRRPSALRVVSLLTGGSHRPVSSTAGAGSTLLTE